MELDLRMMKATPLVIPKRMYVQGDQGGILDLKIKATMTSRWILPNLKVNLIQISSWIGFKSLKESSNSRTSRKKER